MVPMPECARSAKNAASLSSPTHAKHHDRPVPETHANFGHEISSGLSSPYTDLDTTHTRSNPVAAQFSTERAGKMRRRPRYEADNDAELDEITQYYYKNFPSDPEEVKKSIEPIVEMDTDSPGSRPEDRWAEPPVGHVPASWPTGPQYLAPGRYMCPQKGCEDRVGPEDSDDGYTRETLGPHIITSHGGDDGLDDLRSAVRTRSNHLRRAQGRRERRDVTPVFFSRLSNSRGIQGAVDDLVKDLEEIRDWERQGKHPPRLWFPDTFALRRFRTYHSRNCSRWLTHSRVPQCQRSPKEADGQRRQDALPAPQT